jgi:hypothetical protein
MDGFDLCDTANVYLAQRGWTGSQVTSNTGRVAGRALTSTWGGSASLTSGSFGNKATVGVGFAHRRTALPATPFTMFALFDSTGAVEQCSLQINANGSLSVSRGNQAAILGTSVATGLIVAGAWRYIEIMSTIDDVVGSMEVRVDNQTVLMVTGVDTKQGSNAWADRVRVYVSGNNSDLYDDMYFLDTDGSTNNALVGDSRIEPHRPTGDAAVTWTPSAGLTNFGVVDDVVIDTTDFIFSDVAGAIDKFDLADLATPPAAIYGVELITSYAKADAGPRTMRGFIESGGTVANGAIVAPLLNTHMIAFQRWDTDPHTSGPWTPAAINALRAGVEIVT